MSISRVLCASALAVCAASAYADDKTATIPFVPNTSVPGSFSAGWGATHQVAGSFTDTFTYDGLTSPYLFSGSLVTIGGDAGSMIDITSVTVNGSSYQLNDVNTAEVATIRPVSLSGPVEIKVNGIAAPSLFAGTAISASYGATANVTSAVPEPGSMALAMAGLGFVGLLSRRRLGR